MMYGVTSIHKTWTDDVVQHVFLVVRGFVEAHVTFTQETNICITVNFLYPAVLKLFGTYPVKFCTERKKRLQPFCGMG